MTIRHVIPVISGKGGVGKSTVAVNLAVALAKTGAKVGLLDSDFYGPSVPTLMGGGDLSKDHEDKLIPPLKYGVKYVSLGFFLAHPDTPVMWRGPMLNKSLLQLFHNVSWGEVDYLVVDMPPGTGDTHITLSQMEGITISGAVSVTTPQEVALADVRKAMNMLKHVNMPILGVVENMAGFVTPDGVRHDIFGAGGGAAVADAFGVPLLVSLPVDITIREGGDKGVPVAADGKSPVAPYFDELARKVIEAVDQGYAAKPSVSIVN